MQIFPSLFYHFYEHLLSIARFYVCCLKGDRNISILETRKSCENFLWTFEKLFKILTGRKFEIECLLSVFLPRGLTQATWASLGKILCLKLLFIAIESGVLKGSAVTLIKAEGILSSPIAFLGLSSWGCFWTSSLLTGKNIGLSLMFPLVVMLLFIFNILGWFLYELQMSSTACLSLSIVWFLAVLVGFWPPDFSLMFI